MTRSARFRYRDASGQEHELVSVEELSREIETGRLDLDTQLLDSGIGKWERAGDLSIVQFIVDELRREGRLPESWKSESGGVGDARGGEARAGDPPAADPPAGDPPAGDPSGGEAMAGDPPSAEDPVDVDPSLDDAVFDLAGEDHGAESEQGVGPEPDESEPADLEELPYTPDPFEMHLPKTLEEGEEASDEAEDRSQDRPDDMSLHEWLLTQSGPPPDRPDEPPPDRPRKPPRPSDDPWGTPRRGSRLRDLEPVAPSGPIPEDDGRGDRSLDRDVPPDSESEDWEEPTEPEGSDADEIRSRPPPPRRDGRGRTPRRRRERMRGMVVAMLVLGGGVLAAALLMIPWGGEPVPTSTTGEPGVTDSPPIDLDLPPFPVPEGLADALVERSGPPGAEGGAVGPSERMEALVATELEQVLDSVRAEMGIQVVPPPGWLSGEYLSSASRFDGTDAFWEIYRDFVERLAAEDEEIYLLAARRGWAAAAGVEDPDDVPGSDPSLGGFLDDMGTRYDLVSEARADGYARRLRVADQAIELHRFLLAYEDRIQYAPALGQGVSADPILEAVPADAETREALDQQLDLLFAALDQTRSGIPPALGGLRTELFHRLTEPI